MRKLSLRPYHGQLYIAKTIKEYETAHQQLFKIPDVLTCTQVVGRFSSGEGNNGMWTYLIWAKEPHVLAHEIAHVVLHVFKRCGIDPRKAGGEPFCYMLSQLLLEAKS